MRSEGFRICHNLQWIIDYQWKARMVSIVVRFRNIRYLQLIFYNILKIWSYCIINLQIMKISLRYPRRKKIQKRIRNPEFRYFRKIWLILSSASTHGTLHNDIWSLANAIKSHYKSTMKEWFLDLSMQNSPNPELDFHCEANPEQLG